MTWSLKGTYIETSNCAAACPCVLLGEPTEGECRILLGWHIQQGQHDDVRLDGLNVALAVHSRGNMATPPWKAAVYVDERADDRQKESLLKIFGGHAGGHPGAIPAAVDEILGVRQVPIDFRQDDKRFRIRVGDVGAAELEVEGQRGGFFSPFWYEG